MSQRGALLIEVVVALAITSLVGVAALHFGQASVGLTAEMALREQELRRADQLLLAYSMATAAELDQRIGSQNLGPYLVRVQRPDPELYRVSVSKLTRPDAELLVTVVYRRQAP